MPAAAEASPHGGLQVGITELLVGRMAKAYDIHPCVHYMHLVSTQTM